jgi:two-component system copper resistance phosphate regulon response regulator CusR
MLDVECWEFNKTLIQHENGVLNHGCTRGGMVGWDLLRNLKEVVARGKMWGLPSSPPIIRMRVLIVEDDEKTALALSSGLERGGFATAMAHTGEDGLFLLNSETFDLVVLDWMLPGRSGIELLKTLRSRGSKTPVLLLTARDAVDDRVLGLESGADDYLVKPFAFAELLARIRTLLRRSGPSEPLRKTIADLVVDLESRRVWRKEKPIELTPREFDLLAFLLRQPGQVVTREMLAKEVWREASRITPLDNVIDVHVAHLRAKVDEGHGLKLIHTIRGVGFVLREEAIG